MHPPRLIAPQFADLLLYLTTAAKKSKRQKAVSRIDKRTPNSKTVLLDAMALIYRAHFALIRSPRFTRSGQCTSAVFGMANTLLDLTSREKPSQLAAAFDTSDPTARHVAYPEYKAHRDEMPEDLSSQLPLIDQLMDAFCVPALRLPGYEADDIIGTLAHQAEAEGFQTLMVTPDKDYDQLVTPSIQIWKPGRQGNSPELFGVPSQKKMGGRTY